MTIVLRSINFVNQGIKAAAINTHICVENIIPKLFSIILIINPCLKESSQTRKTQIFEKIMQKFNSKYFQN